MADRVGQQLGHYRLVRLLGRGGFAEVYLGEHIHLNTQAAVKVLNANLPDDELDRFRNEARTIAHLEHPHIVGVLDFGVEDGLPFLIMHYAPNGTLRQRHPRGTRLPLHIILPYMRQIADALQYAHDEKLVHRDIKPENMLLGRRGELLLSDFGLATIAQSAHSLSKSDIAGTVTYMAPEQFRGNPSAASDQYALGIVLYEWLSGDYPFHGYALETAIQHILNEPMPLHEKIPTLSPLVEQVVMQALAKEPHQRFACMQAFAQAFEQACVSATTDTTDTSVTSVTTDTKAMVSTSQQPLISSPLGDSKLSMPAEEQYRTMALPSISRFPLPARTSIGALLCIYRGHTAAVTSLAWSPDGTYLVSGSNDQTAQVWNSLTSAKALTFHGHASWVHAVTWSPDSTYIASGSWDTTVQIWDARSGSNVLTYRGHTKNVNAVAWSPHSTHIASAGYDQTVQVWDVTTGGHVYTYSGHSAAVNCVAWSPQSKRLASASLDQSAHVWDAPAGGHVFAYHGHTGGVHAVAWSPNGKRLASGSKDGTVQIWDESKAINVFSKSKVTTYRGHVSTIHALDWSPDSKYIASGDKDGTVHIWETTGGNTIFTYRNHNKQINAVTWSPNGKLIASASDDKTIHVWFGPSRDS